jgi:hypothetical protein
MNNPFKTIIISLIASILGIFILFELPKMMLQLDQSQWLLAMMLPILITILLLINIFNNSQRLQQSMRRQPNN